MIVDAREGKEAETNFKVLARRTDDIFGSLALIEARPLTGRTHQIRVHLAQSGHPILGDELYAPAKDILASVQTLALRAMFLGYQDPFRRMPVKIRAPGEGFLKEFGFSDFKPT
jgi:23S rRNA pseudouridine1911/1915/1917 synthase